MNQHSTTGTAGAPDASTQGVTLSIPTHMAAPSHRLILREGPKPTRPRCRIPRVARLLALAYHFQELLDTRVVETQAELAELAKRPPARVTQIMNLLGLAPDIQEEIFFIALCQKPPFPGRSCHEAIMPPILCGRACAPREARIICARVQLTHNPRRLTRAEPRMGAKGSKSSSWSIESPSRR